MEHSCNITRWKIGELLCSRIITQVIGTEVFSYHYRINVTINGFQQARSQHLASKSPQIMERFPRPSSFRLPFTQYPKEYCSDDISTNLLEYQCPDSKACICHNQSDKSTYQGASKRDYRLCLEINLLGKYSLLYGTKRIKQGSQSRNLQEVCQYRSIIEIGY